MFPSHARMYIAPICDDETWAERVDFWYNMYVVVLLLDDYLIMLVMAST